MIITYNIIKRITSPLSDDQIQNYDAASIVSIFLDAGFTNVSSKEDFDLDPDTTTALHINEVVIGGSTTREEHSDFLHVRRSDR